mmetsp:Transcript_16039/g.43765  ORF Transcript_16039/g.43765 Transcript_16039/m.43765 type:complete len:209 (+) Transcript_16039:914-1540(+)
MSSPATPPGLRLSTLLRFSTPPPRPPRGRLRPSSPPSAATSPARHLAARLTPSADTTTPPERGPTPRSTTPCSSSPPAPPPGSRRLRCRPPAATKPPSPCPTGPSSSSAARPTPARSRPRSRLTPWSSTTPRTTHGCPRLPSQPPASVSAPRRLTTSSTPWAVTPSARRSTMARWLPPARRRRSTPSKRSSMSPTPTSGSTSELMTSR